MPYTLSIPDVADFEFPDHIPVEEAEKLIPEEAWNAHQQNRVQAQENLVSRDNQRFALQQERARLQGEPEPSTVQLFSEEAEIPTSIEAVKGTGSDIYRGIRDPLARVGEVGAGLAMDVARLPSRLSAGEPLLQGTQEALRKSSDELAAPFFERVTGVRAPPLSEGFQEQHPLAAGLIEGANEQIDFFTSPQFVSMLGIAGLPKAVQRTVVAGFISQMSGHFPEAWAEFNRAMGTGDTREAARIGVGLATQGLMIGSGAKHLLQQPAQVKPGVRFRPGPPTFTFPRRGLRDVPRRPPDDPIIGMPAEKPPSITPKPFSETQQNVIDRILAKSPDELTADDVATLWIFRNKARDRGNNRARHPLDVKLRQVHDAGFEVGEIGGIKYDEGMPHEVIAARPVKGLKEKRIGEVLSPPVFKDGKLAKNAVIELDVPELKASIIPATDAALEAQAKALDVPAFDEAGQFPTGSIEQMGFRPDIVSRVGRAAPADYTGEPTEKVVGAEELKAPQETFEQFSTRYREAFSNMSKYGPGEVGSQVWAERMAKMSDEHPDWVDRIEGAEVPTPDPAASPAPATPVAKEPWQMTKEEYHAQFPRTETGKVQTESELNSTLKQEAKALEESGDLEIEQRPNGQNFKAKTAKGRGWIKDASARSFDRLNKSAMSAGIRANEAATIAGESASHKIAIQEAIRAGETIPPEVLADYPDLKPATPVAEAKPAAPAKPASETPQTLEQIDARLVKIAEEIKDINKGFVTGDNAKQALKPLKYEQTRLMVQRQILAKPAAKEPVRVTNQSIAVGDLVERAIEIISARQKEAASKLESLSESDIRGMDKFELDALHSDVTRGPGNPYPNKEILVNKLLEYIKKPAAEPVAETFEQRMVREEDVNDWIKSEIQSKRPSINADEAWKKYTAFDRSRGVKVVGEDYFKSAWETFQRPKPTPEPVAGEGKKAITPEMSIHEKEQILGAQIRDSILNAPSFPKLLAAVKSFRKSLRGPLSEEWMAEKMKEPWDFLSEHAGVMNAKSARAKTLQSLADAVIREAKLPMQNAGKYRGMNYRINWDKIAEIEKQRQGELPVEPLGPGMGGAIPEEFEASFRTSTGIKREAIEAARADRGREPTPTPERQSQQVALERVKQKVDDDPGYQDRLVSELTDQPRPITSDEVLALDMRYVDLQTEYAKARRAGEQAHADGYADGVLEAKRRADYWDNKLAEFERMARATGSHWGRTGAMMQRMMRADFTLEAMESRARSAKNFEPLTDAERAEIKDLHEQITAKDKSITEKEEAIRKLEVDKAMAAVELEVAKQPKYSPSVLEHAEKFAKYMDRRAEVASGELRAMLSRVSVGVDPAILAKVAIIGASKLTRGVVDFAKWSEAMVKDFGEGIRDYLEAGFRAAQSLLDSELESLKKQVGKSTAESVKKAVKKEDVQGRIDEAKEKIATISEEGEMSDLTPQVKKLAEGLWQQGIREINPMIDALQGILEDFIPGISRQETMDALSGRGKFWQASQEEVKRGIRDLSTQARLIAHQMDVEAGKPIPRTGYQPDPMSKEARQEQQRLNELKRKFGVVVTDPTRQLASALQASKTYLRNRMTDLRQEIKTRERIVKTKTAITPDAELEAMRKEYEAVKKEHEEIFEKPGMTIEKRHELAVKAAERAEAAWNERLANARRGFFGPIRKPGAQITSAQLNVIRARTEAARQQVKELKDLANPKRTPKQIALQAALTRTANRIAELNDKMARNDFSKRPKSTPSTDPELLRLKGDLEKVREQFRAREEKFKWDQLNIFQKTAKGAVMAYDAARMIMTTGEFSFVLRQGKFFAMSRPLTVIREIPETLRAFASERNARASEITIREDVLYPESQTAKLHISREGDGLTRQEELVMGRLSNIVPVVRNFNRAAVTFLNRVRFDSWLAMRKTMSRMGEPTAVEDQMYARMANEGTGRGGLGGAEGAAVTLGRVFFAPRYFASRIQLAVGHAMWGGTARSRAVIATEYARHLVGLAVYYNLLLFGLNALRDKEEKVKLSFNPRSSDFGKIVIGKTRLDPLAGMAQLATFGGRTATGETKSTTTGRVTPIRGRTAAGESLVPYGKPGWWEVAGKFGASKAHPVPIAVGNLFAGVDLFGNEASLQTEAGKFIGPITYIDIYQALRAQGLSEGTALGILAFLGEGLQTYNKK